MDIRAAFGIIGAICLISGYITHNIALGFIGVIGIAGCAFSR